jgi:PAS domain S-box-containing protein
MYLSDVSSDDLDPILNTLKTSVSNSPERIQQLVQRLSVRHYELEMQNRALRERQLDLAKSLRRYKDLYEQLPVGYVVLDEAGIVRKANATACELLRHPKSDLLARSFREFLAEEDQTRLITHLDLCMRHTERFTMEATLRRAEPAPITMQLCSQAEAPDGPAERIIRMALTDISHLKSTQRALEEINREQEAFTYSVSHDLRAPLVTIAAFSEMLENDWGARLDETGRDMLARIRRAAQRMDHILGKLIEYSRMSRTEVHPERVNLDEFIAELTIEHHGLIKQSRASVEVQPNLPCVMAARDLLRQALGNLLTNALKYHRKDRAPIVRISAHQTENMRVIIRVADEGIGIAPENHQRIFKLFERLHGQASYPGTGIGLALVQRAAERMGGQVWVESEVNRGSRFCLALPAALDSAAQG